jgi:hypothetical protein
VGQERRGQRRERGRRRRERDALKAMRTAKVK